MASSGSIPRFAALLFALGVCIYHAHAQDRSHVAGMANVGYLNTPNFNSSVNALTPGTAEYEKGYSLVGLDFYYRRNRAVVAWSGLAALQTFKQDGNNWQGPTLWNTHVSFGWVVSGMEKVIIYPSMGAGWTFVSFTSLGAVASPAENEAHARAPSLNAGIHIDYLISDAAVGDLINGIVLGFKAGYITPVRGTHWRMSDGERGAEIRPYQLQGWYATISLGGLAFAKKR